MEDGSMKRFLITLGCIVVGVPLFLIVVVAIFIDPIVRMGVEKGCSAVLKVPTHLASAVIRFSGRATMEGLRISNPPGYQEPVAVAFDKFEAAVRPSALFKKVIKIDEMTVEKPELTLEFKGTKSNWGTLMENLSGGKEPAPKKEEPRAETPPGKTFIIHQVRITGAVAHFRSDLIPGGTTSVALPPVELKDVGTAEGGATMGQLLSTILQSLGDSALKAGQGIVPPDLLKSLNTEVLERAKKLPGQAMEVLKEQEKAAEETLKKKLPGAK
jgi:hypothetical protein